MTEQESKQFSETIEPAKDKEYEQKVERLQAMGKSIGEDFGMKVEVGKKPGWRYIFSPHNKIEADPQDVKDKNLEYCFGVIAHEGAHRKISKIDFIPKNIWNERGFSYLMNAIEDPRVNNWVSGKYDGAKDWLEDVYNEDLSTEDKIGKTAKEKLGYVPKHIQFGQEIIRYWHTKKFSDALPIEVKEALDKTNPYAKFAYNSIPGKSPDESEITDTSKMMYKVVYSTIWPEYQKLIEKSLDDETMRQKIKEMLENGEIKLGEEGQSSEGEPLPTDQLPEDLQEEIKKKLKDKLDNMTDEERKEFEERNKEKAQKNLDELETEENKDLEGGFAQEEKKDAKSKGGEEAKKEADKKAQEEAEVKRRKELDQIQKEIEKQLKKGKSEYDKAYDEVQPYIQKVADDIKNIFISQRWPLFKKGFPGQKLRLKGAMDYKARKNYHELFETREKLERKDYNFLILVDLSGSMKGNKIEETFKGTVLFVEALNQVASTMHGVKVAIYGFQDDIIEYKNFDKNLDDNIRNGISVMKKEVENKGIHNRASYNNDGYCLDKTQTILELANGKNNFLFVLSDGQPASDGTHHLLGYGSNTDKEELQDVIKNISQGGKINLLGIGLGAGTEHVGTYYDDKLFNVQNIPNVNIKQLVKVLANKLEELIK